MAKPKGLTVAEDDVSQTIDLNKLVGADISNDEGLVNEMGQAVIDFMLKRVKGGEGIGGKQLKTPYSKDYADSLEFKAAGKSKGKVNMTLSGDMLGAIDIVKADGAVIKIGFADEAQIPKAYGHMTGFEGHPTIKDGPRREFFGVTLDELKSEILPKFQAKVKEAKAADRQARDNNAATATAVRSIQDLISFEEQ